MLRGGDALERLEKSPVANISNIIVCITIGGAMFAGSYDIVAGSKVASYIVMFILVCICFYVVKKGTASLGKISTVLLPFMIIFLLINGGLSLDFSKPLLSGQNSLACIYYAVMYVVFNTSNSGLLLAHMSKNLSKKQKARVSFASALVLSAILLLANILLLQNGAVCGEDMPLLAIFGGGGRVVMQIVLFLGCITTLFSLVFSLACSLRGLMRARLANILAVILPLIVSFAGFGFIVSQLYPLTSVLSALIIFDLFLLPFFKKPNKRIHCSGKDAK